MDRGEFSSFPASDLSRRLLIRQVAGGALAAAVTVSALLARPLASVAAQAATGPFQGETYVGETSDPYLLAAVVIGEEAEEAARQARAYLCKTPVHMPGGIDEWLEGTYDGETLDLVSESGARLEAQLADGVVSGTVTVADGGSVTCFLTRARGAAGLYSGPREDRMLKAMSSEGGTLEELVAERPDESFTLPDYWQIGHERQAYPAVAIITPPEGPPVVITTYYDTIEPAERLRVIVLNDGRHNGAGLTKGGDWSCRIIDF